jgi:hypothetical protein
MSKQQKEWYRDIVSYFAEQANWDWYNNEGGGGTVEVDLETGEWDVSGYYNITETESADGTSGTVQIPVLDAESGEELYN